MPVGEGLTIVIVLLLAEAEVSEGHFPVGCGGDIVDAAAGYGGKAEVLRDDGQNWLAIAPLRVVDGSEGLVVVAAPLGFSEAGVATECYPVCDRADKRISGGSGGKVSNVVKHAIGDHLLTFMNYFVFLNSIGHYFYVVNVGLVGTG